MYQVQRIPKGRCGQLLLGWGGIEESRSDSEEVLLMPSLERRVNPFPEDKEFEV